MLDDIKSGNLFLGPCPICPSPLQPRHGPSFPLPASKGADHPIESQIVNVYHKHGSAYIQRLPVPHRTSRDLSLRLGLPLDLDVVVVRPLVVLGLDLEDVGGHVSGVLWVGTMKRDQA